MTDEQISTYIDGQLNDPEYSTFKKDLAQNAKLQQKVALTRLLVREARQLSVQPLPKHFALPASYARPTKMLPQWLDGRLFLRAASLFSAAVCAVLLSIDAGQWSGRTPSVQQAVARTMTPIQEILPSAAKANSTPMSEHVAVPTATPGTYSSVLRAAEASPALSSVPQSTDTPATALPVPITPAPSAIADTPANTRISLLPRVLGLLSGLAALLFAGLGWRQR